MTMSKDRITFFLPPRYFTGTPSSSTNGMSRATCLTILGKAFGPPRQHTRCSTWNEVMDLWSCGFRIVCRPSQFARFIVYRANANECINGIKDLNPAIVPEQKPETTYSKLEKRFCEEGISGAITRRLLHEACVKDVPLDTDADDVFNVSRNPHEGYGK